MKRNALRARKIQATPTDAELAVLWSDVGDADPGDAFEDRVSESLVDYEDEREAVEAVVFGMTGSMH